MRVLYNSDGFATILADIQSEAVVYSCKYLINNSLNLYSMKITIKSLTVYICLIASLMLQAQPKQFNNPKILSFENSVAPAEGDANSQLSVNNEHFKHLTSSLNWKWNAPAAQWSIKQPIDYKLHDKNSKDNFVSTFVFWIYAKSPLKDAKLKVEFLKNGRVCSFFEYGLDFSGWRGSWIAFDRDMQGKPEVGMDEMRITAPNIASGELLFDHIMLASLQDIRQHTPDLQAPYINPNTQNHWLVLLQSWNLKFDLPTPSAVSASEQKSVEEIQNRLTDYLLEGKKATALTVLTDAVNAYEIRENADGTVNGLPVFPDRFGETYEYLGAENYKVLFNNSMGTAITTELMLRMAVSYHKTKNEKEKGSIGNLFVLLMRHFLDQGFQAGSALGTLHHLGYNFKDFYTAAFLMKNVLVEAKLGEQVQQSMEWFSGTGELKTKPKKPGMDIDTFNTNLIARLTSILMMSDSPEKTRYLQAFTRWIDNGLLFTEGTDGSFKHDGSIFHHRANYPAYAIGGLEGAVLANYLMYKTDFQPNPTGREHLKAALIAMRNYCNLQTWPLAISGRHPDGKGHLIPEHFALMALTGTPDYSSKIDKELAAAYLRLETKATTKFTKKFTSDGIQAESSPTGNWSYNYSCLNVHRRDNWLVASKGFSRYLWASEIYVGANHYGRYLSHGSLQILATGDPISSIGAGFNDKGWDWNHFPGTTAAVLPMKELRGEVNNVDSVSGFEEMLLSDESYAGSLSSQNKQGIFAMKLHENPKYNGSLYARKSYFFFDNRVVALGSGVRSALPEKEVHTTLFQVYLPTPETNIVVNKQQISQFPFNQTLSKGNNYLSDGLNNWFFVKSGKVEVSKSPQNSRDKITDAPTQNNFALAAINHGAAPKNGDYEYMVLVQPKANELNTTVKAFGSTNKMPYVVLQKDSFAHIVKDKTTNSVGYALFEAGKLKIKADVLSVDKACMLMTKKLASDRMVLSVCDPDLNFYQGKADEKFDDNGKYIERSVYARTWKDNESKASELEVQIAGKWKLENNSEYISIVSVVNNITTLKVKTQHAFTREIVMKKR